MSCCWREILYRLLKIIKRSVYRGPKRWPLRKVKHVAVLVCNMYATTWSNRWWVICLWWWNCWFGCIDVSLTVFTFSCVLLRIVTVKGSVERTCGNRLQLVVKRKNGVLLKLENSRKNKAHNTWSRCEHYKGKFRRIQGLVPGTGGRCNNDHLLVTCTLLLLLYKSCLLCAIVSGKWLWWDLQVSRWHLHAKIRLINPLASATTAKE